MAYGNQLPSAGHNLVLTYKQSYRNVYHRTIWKGRKIRNSCRSMVMNKLWSMQILFHSEHQKRTNQAGHIMHTSRPEARELGVQDHSQLPNEF